MSPGRWRCSARRTTWLPPSPTLASSSPALLPFVQRNGKPSSLIRGGEKQLHELSWVKSVKQNCLNFRQSIIFVVSSEFVVTGSICREGRKPGQLSSPTALVKMSKNNLSSWQQWLWQFTNIYLLCWMVSHFLLLQQTRDGRGRLVVADTGNDRVQVLSSCLLLIREAPP